MAAPTNSSGKLRVAGGTGSQTSNAGFTFTAGRQAVLTIAGYADGTAITGVTIGGTAATKRAESAGPDYAAVWDVLGAGVAGGTSDVVVSVAPGTPNVYLSLAVEEWAAGSLSYDTGTANNSSVANTNAPSIATAGALSTASSIVYSALNMYGINGTCVPTQPTGWTSSFGESDGTTYEMGMGCWHEENSTGIKTALYSLSTNNDTQLVIAGYIMGSSPDVTVNLTGQSVTASSGTILPARSLSLVGQSVATALGTLTPARSLPLTGQAITASQGAIAASTGSNVSANLTGSDVTASAGTLAPSKAMALSGQPATASAGTLVPGKSFSLTGQAATSAAGTITADPQSYVVVVGTPDPTSAYRITATPDIDSGDWIQWRGVGGGAPPTGLSVLSDATWMFSSGNTPANFDVRISDDGGATWGSWATQSVGVTVSLTGQAATVSAGTAGNTHAITPTGQAVTASAGTLTRALSITLTGSAVTASAGSIVAAVARALSGLGLSISQGTISVSAGGNVTVGLTGLGATAAQGALAPSITAALSGLSATSAQGSVALGKAFTISGLQVATSQGSLALSAALQLVGSALSIAQGSIAVTAGGNVTVSLTGQQVAAAIGTLSPAAAAALTGGAATTAAGVVSLARALTLLGLPATVSQGTITAQGGTGVTVNLTGLVMALTGGNLSPEMATVLQGAGIQVDAGTVYALTPAAGGSPNPFPSVEGQVASPNPVSVILNPQEGTPVAGEIGCIIGRFGRMDENGEVWNGRRGDHETLGFVLAWPGGWGSVYWTDGRPVMRAGLPITIAAGGDFWARFSGGAVAGARVYASLVDGAAVSGYAAGCEPTPWYVVTQAAAGELAIISTTSRVN